MRTPRLDKLEYTPWDDGGGGLRMGLKPIAEHEWLQRPLDYKRRLVQRRKLASTRTAAVYGRMHGADVDRAIDESCEFIAAARPVDSSTPTTHAARALEPLARAGVSICEDLCVLLPGRDGYRLVAALVCAPSFWRLHEKLGRALPGIHAPVPGLQEKIGPRIDAFLEGLDGSRIFGRGNWHLHNSGELFHPGPDDWTLAQQLTPSNIGERLWLRCERQTLRRLPDTNAVLFTILVYVQPLDRLRGQLALAETLWSAYQAMPDAEREARHYSAFARPLRAWLDMLQAAAATGLARLGASTGEPD